MGKILVTLGVVVAAVLAVPISAAAASTSAQIVSCSSNQFGCFSPNPIQITVGSTVTWKNNTMLTHTATSDSGAWNTGNIPSGQTSSPIVFNSAGTFTYHCSIHPSMTGTVIVSAAASATPVPTVRQTTSARTRTLAQSGGGTPALPLGAGLALAGIALLAVSVFRRRQPRA